MFHFFSYNLLAQWTLLFVIAIYAFYKWSTCTYDTFKNKGMAFEKPIPFFGNFIGTFWKSPFLVNTGLYQKFRNEKLYGFYEFRKPVHVIVDPDLIKQITVKDFDHFMNRRMFAEIQNEPLFNNSLFFLRDQKWKDMRMTLNPIFTGRKLRQMFELVEKCCKIGVLHLKNQTEWNAPIVLEMKDYFSKITNDLIASTAFGIEVNSLADKENTFYKMGRKVTNFSGLLTTIKMLLFANSKAITKMLNIKLFEDETTGYFKSLVLDAMKYRVEHGIVRNDMINLLIEARKELNKTDKIEKREWSDDDIVAQCFLFFFAGFDTTSSITSFCAHEIMENPEIQERLIKEIDEVREQLNENPLTYEVLKEMKYLDMVVSETLRKWPIAIILDRVCVKPYTLHDVTTGKSIDFSPGEILSISVCGSHRNPEHFPNPSKFDPERFSDENKHKILPFTYIPFGCGPRICIGARFTLMETKAMIFYLLSEFTLKASPKTSIPIKLAPSNFQVKPLDGFWLQLEPRN